MNIAVIIYGQPRFIDNPHCFSSQKEFIFDQGETDVFAHLWYSDNDSYESSSWSGMSKCPVGNDDIGSFMEKWNPVILHQEKEKEFSNPKLFQKIKERFPDPKWNESDFNKALSHLYSLEKAIEAYKKGKNKEYDWVVFLRTDVCVWGFPRLEYLTKNKFYYSSLFPAEHFADVSFIVSPEYVDKLEPYSYLTDESLEIVDRILKPCAEQFKKATFLKNFNIEDLYQIPLLVRIVRSVSDRGIMW